VNVDLNQAIDEAYVEQVKTLFDSFVDNLRNQRLWPGGSPEGSTPDGSTPEARLKDGLDLLRRARDCMKQIANE